MSEEGILQIFKGVPKSDNAIHSFFQIDMKKLESYERAKLKRGIRIKSKEGFVKTIEKMKQYAVQNKKKQLMMSCFFLFLSKICFAISSISISFPIGLKAFVLKISFDTSYT